MANNDVVRGSASICDQINVTLSPSSVANATSAEQTFTMTGAALGDFVMVSKPTAQAGLVISTARVSAANTIAITFANVTAATITPTAAEVYVVFRTHTYYQPAKTTA